MATRKKATKTPVKRGRVVAPRRAAKTSGDAREAPSPPETAAVWHPLAELSPWDANPRRNDEAVRPVARSIIRLGWGAPIVAWVDPETGAARIIAGHTRRRAALMLSELWDAATSRERSTWHPEAVQVTSTGQAPTRLRRDLTSVEAELLAIADNKLGELAEWDEDGLAKVLGSFSDEDQALAGFSESELSDLAGDDDADPTEDDVPEPPKNPITKLGDLWILGTHRLLCGDSTLPDNVARLMGEDRARLMNTDPPYGVSYANAERPNPGVAKPRVAKPRVAKPRVANDEMRDAELQKFLEAAFRAAKSGALTKDAAWYMWHAHLTQGYFAAAAAAAAADVILHRQIIWVKPVLLLGRGQYHWKHEPCFMGWVKGSQPPDYGEGDGERTQTTVWEVGSVTHAERKEFNHATPKPVKLFEIPIIKHTKRGEVAYEPFAGSGPQFIAAEIHHRKCFGLELDPAHCDVIVERWQNLTGQKATRKKAA